MKSERKQIAIVQITRHGITPTSSICFAGLSGKRTFRLWLHTTDTLFIYLKCEKQTASYLSKCVDCYPVWYPWHEGVFLTEIISKTALKCLVVEHLSIINNELKNYKLIR